MQLLHFIGNIEFNRWTKHDQILNKILKGKDIIKKFLILLKSSNKVSKMFGIAISVYIFPNSLWFTTPMLGWLYVIPLPVLRKLNRVHKYPFLSAFLLFRGKGKNRRGKKSPKTQDDGISERSCQNNPLR